MTRQTLRTPYPFHSTQPLVSQGYNPKREASSRFSRVMAGILIYGMSGCASLAILLGLARSIALAFAA